MTALDPNQLQAQALFARGLASRLEILEAWREANRREVDLALIFVEQDRLSITEARALREQTRERSRRFTTTGLGLSDAVIIKAISGRVDGEGLLHDEAGDRRSFAGYEILAELDRGGVGVVLRARKLGQLREVALKLLLESKLFDDDTLARFRKEVAVLRELRHPQVVAFLDAGEEMGLPYLVMELIRGPTLKEIAGEGLELERAMMIFDALADGLQAAHAVGVYHRDLKPGNIMIAEARGPDEAERPVIIDFGLARIEQELFSSSFESLSLRVTKQGEILGTPSFMAPEQLIPGGEFGEGGAATDVWAWGACLVFALTGKAPFDEFSRNNFELFNALLKEEPADLRRRRAELPVWVEDLCRWCLRKHADERPSFDQVRQSLRERAVPREGQRPRKSRAPALVMIGLAAVALVAVLAFWRREAVASRFIDLKAPEWTRDSMARIRGRVGPRARSVLIGRLVDGAWNPREAERLPVDSTGSFSKEIMLQEGPNWFRLRFEVGEAVDRSVLIQRDTRPPRIVVEDANEGAVVLPGVESQLRGRVLDLGPGAAFLGQRPMELDRAGGFATRLSEELGADGVARVVLRARDRAGNESELDLRVVTREAARRLSAAILSDGLAWSTAEEWQQDLARRSAAARLGPSFRYLRTERYRCGERSERIATFLHEPTGIELNLVPGGRVRLGSDRDHDWEQPRRWASVRPFLIARTEVSQAVWDRIGGKDERKWRGEDLPIEGISWDEARTWLTRAGDGLRLPGEAEWEYAARAGSTRRFYWGDDFDTAYLWHKGNSEERTHPVAVPVRAPGVNAFGLLHVLGNVWEWCADDWIADYRSGPSSGAPRKLDGKERVKVLRGGSWFNEPEDLHVAHRYGFAAETRFGNLGLRPVVSLPLE